MELLEDRLELVGLDADTGIDDFKPARVAQAIADHLHAAVIRVANRVGHQVLDDLAEQVDGVALGLEDAAQGFRVAHRILGRTQRLDPALEGRLLGGNAGELLQV